MSQDARHAAERHLIHRVMRIAIHDAGDPAHGQAVSFAEWWSTRL
jgi:hypothetical protein